MRRSVLAGALVAAMLLACALMPAGTPTPTVAPTATDTPTTVPTATATASPVPIATDTPTTVPSATATFTPLPTATQTATPDIYANAALSLDDLPDGFSQLSDADLTRLQLSPADLQADIGKAYTEGTVHNVTGFTASGASDIQIVSGFCFYELGDLDLNVLDTALHNPDLVVKEFANAATLPEGAKAVSKVLTGLGQLGNSRLAVDILLTQPAGVPVREDVTIVRRARLAEYVFSIYLNGKRPLIDYVKLAKLLDGHVLAAQTP
jgi:hypothetical protein